jgi:hypothetical protein
MTEDLSNRSGQQSNHRNQLDQPPGSLICPAPKEGCREKPGGVTVSLLRGAGQPLPALWVSVSTDRNFNRIPGVSYNAHALLRPLPIVGGPLPSLSPVERSFLKKMAIGQPPAPVDPTERRPPRPQPANNARSAVHHFHPLRCLRGSGGSDPGRMDG